MITEFSLEALLVVQPFLRWHEIFFDFTVLSFFWPATLRQVRTENNASERPRMVKT